MNGIALEYTRSTTNPGTDLPAFAIVDLLNNVYITLETWRQRHRASMPLARVGTPTLQDIGITESSRLIAVN